MMGQKKKKLNISRTIILDQLGKRRFLIETTQDESPEYGKKKVTLLPNTKPRNKN